MDKNITIPQKEIAPGIFSTGGTATMPTVNPLQSNVITPGALQPQPKIDIATTPVPQTPSIEGDMAYYNQLVNQQSEAQKQLEATRNQGLGDVSKLMQELTGQGTEQLSLEQQFVNPIQQQLQGLTGQIGTELADYRQAEALYEKAKSDIEAGAGRKGITTSAVMGQQGAIDRAKASELNVKASNIALLQAQAQAVQGRLDLAQRQVDRAIDLKYKSKEQEIEVKKFQLGVISDLLTKEEKKQADSLNMALNKEEKRIAEAKENEKAIEKMLLDATPNAPASVIANAKAIKDKGGSSLEVAQALGKYGGDYLKTEMLKEQIKTEQAQRANIYNTIAARNADTARQNATAITPGGGKPPTEGQILNAGYADRIRLANDIVASKTDTLKNMNYATFKLLESKSQLANKLLTPDQRQAGQAMRNFITAKLRKESGAAISPTEFDDARLQYFPALGDDEQTLRNKKVLRDSVLNNLIAGSGNAYKIDPVDTYFNSVTGSVEAVNNKLNNKESSYLMSLTPNK